MKKNTRLTSKYTMKKNIERYVPGRLLQSQRKRMDAYLRASKSDLSRQQLQNLLLTVALKKFELEQTLTQQED